MTRDWWGLVIFPHRTRCMMENTMPIIQTLWPSGKCLKTWPKRKRRSFTVSGNLLLLIFGQSRGQDSARWPPACRPADRIPHSSCFLSSSVRDRPGPNSLHWHEGCQDDGQRPVRRQWPGHATVPHLFFPAAAAHLPAEPGWNHEVQASSGHQSQERLQDRRRCWQQIAWLT